jgi:hypothetical protein
VIDDDGQDEWSTGGFYISKDNVEIKIYGPYAAADLAMEAIITTFSPTPDGGNVLQIPNAQFMRCWPLKQELEKDPTTKFSEDVWTATAIFEVWSIRVWGT